MTTGRLNISRPRHSARRTICALASVWWTVRKPISPTISCDAPMGSPAAFRSALALSTWPYSCSISAVSSKDMDARRPATAAAAAEGVGDPSDASLAPAALTTAAADGNPGAALFGAYL